MAGGAVEVVAVPLVAVVEADAVVVRVTVDMLAVSETATDDETVTDWISADEG